MHKSKGKSKLSTFCGPNNETEKSAQGIAATIIASAGTENENENIPPKAKRTRS